MSSVDETRDDKKAEEELGQISEVNSRSTASQTSTLPSDVQRTLWQNIKRYRKVVYVTFGLTSAILLWGYDNVIVGTVSGMPKFQYALPYSPHSLDFFPFSHVSNLR